MISLNKKIEGWFKKETRLENKLLSSKALDNPYNIIPMGTVMWSGGGSSAYTYSTKERFSLDHLSNFIDQSNDPQKLHDFIIDFIITDRKYDDESQKKAAYFLFPEIAEKVRDKFSEDQPLLENIAKFVSLKTFEKPYFLKNFAIYKLKDGIPENEYDKKLNYFDKTIKLTEFASHDYSPEKVTNVRAIFSNNFTNVSYTPKDLLSSLSRHYPTCIDACLNQPVNKREGCLGDIIKHNNIHAPELEEIYTAGKTVKGYHITMTENILGVENTLIPGQKRT